jgi:hypothetical protein
MQQTSQAPEEQMNDFFTQLVQAITPITMGDRSLLKLRRCSGRKAILAAAKLLSTREGKPNR